MYHTRALIRFNTHSELRDFIDQLSRLEDCFMAESYNGDIRVDAKSCIGMTYMWAENGSQIYLVNQTNDGQFPPFVDMYRP